VGTQTLENTYKYRIYLSSYVEDGTAGEFSVIVKISGLKNSSQKSTGFPHLTILSGTTAQNPRHNFRIEKEKKI
jgi:hypothetical protein